MVPPLVTRKLAPLAQSMAEPPPRPISVRAPVSRQISAPAATCASVGFSSTPSNTCTARPARRRLAASARPTQPAERIPESVTTSTGPSPSDASQRRRGSPGPGSRGRTPDETGEARGPSSSGCPLRCAVGSANYCNREELGAGRDVEHAVLGHRRRVDRGCPCSSRR